MSELNPAEIPLTETLEGVLIYMGETKAMAMARIGYPKDVERCVRHHLDIAKKAMKSPNAEDQRGGTPPLDPLVGQVPEVGP